MKTWLKIFLVLLVLFVLIQFYPYGRDHTNPPVNTTINWDASQTRTLFYNACADCHSNETEWPWYSHIAPASWLVQADVEEARSHFNISEKEGLDHASEAYELVENDEMPLWYYLPFHPDANLDSTEKKALIAGLKATFSENESSPGDGEEAEDSHENHEH